MLHDVGEFKFCIKIWRELVSIEIYPSCENLWAEGEAYVRFRNTTNQMDSRRHLANKGIHERAIIDHWQSRKADHDRLESNVQRRIHDGGGSQIPGRPAGRLFVEFW